MGQAKIKQNLEKTRQLDLLEAWQNPASEHEKQLVNELAHLPIYSIPRVPSETMREIGTQPNQCHLNCLRYVQNQVTTNATMCLGWMVGEVEGTRFYILHSVLEMDAKYVCITPIPNNDDARLLFIPDTQISMVRKDGETKFYRHNEILPTVLRENPERASAYAEQLKIMLDKDMKRQQTCATMHDQPLDHQMSLTKKAPKRTHPR